jgi:hypothetical protein
VADGDRTARGFQEGARIGVVVHSSRGPPRQNHLP